MPNDGDFQERVQEPASNSNAKKVAVIAIDQDVTPTLTCPLGHIVEWGDKDGGSIRLLTRFNMEANTIDPVCFICGWSPNGEAK